MEKVKNAGWKKVQRRRNRNGSICTRVTDLRSDLELDIITSDLETW